MGLTKLKEIFTSIRRTKSNFISITMFVLLGVAIFQGFDFTGYALRESIDSAFRNQDSYDITISYTLGCSENEILNFKSNSHISEAEGYYKAYEYFELNGDEHACAISSLTENINKPIIKEGRLPESDNEIVVLSETAKKLGLHLDDTITLEGGNGWTNYLISQLRDITTREDIQNIINDKVDNFLNNEFTIVGFIAHPTYFTNGVASYGFVPNTSVQIEMLGYVNYSAFNPLITNGYYNNVVLKSDELANKKRYTDDYKNAVHDLMDEINPIAQAIAHDRYETCKNNIDLAVSYESLVTKVATQLKMYGYISDEIFDNYNEIRSQVTTYSSSLSKVEKVNLTALTDNPIFFFGMMSSQIIMNVKYTLGGVFMIVAMLICFSSINRMVVDDAKLIGTKKALGFKNREIYLTYLSYTFLAAFIGLLFGNGFAVLFEYFLVPLTGNTFSFPLFRTLIKPGLIALMSGIILVALELMTYFACRSVIKKNTVDLLQGNISNEHGKTRFYEKTKAWEKLPLVNKTIVNNAMNDKKRCLGTIIGIAASTCMIIGAISMNRNVANAFVTETNDYFKFDYLVYFDPAVDGSLKNIMSYFEENDIQSTPVFREMSYVYINEEDPVLVFSTVYSDYETFSSVVEIDSSSKNKFAYDGFWIAESVRESFNIKESDKAKVITSIGDEADIEITGFFKNYSYITSIFLTKVEYQNAYGFVPEDNTVMVNLRGLDVDKIKNDLNHIDGYKSMYNYEAYIGETINIFGLIADVIVILYVIVCILMGFFIVLNLLITFVNEKKRELITLMVNGYSYKKACQYIYADTILLTIIALILGVGFGIVFSRLIIGSFEGKTICLPHTPNLEGILIGCGITIIIVTLMTLLAVRKIKKFKLSDINSSL